MTDKPMTAIVLLITGSVFYTFGGVTVGLLAKTPTGLARGPGMNAAFEPNWAAITALATGIVCSVAIVICALLIYTGVKRNIRIGSFTSILFSIVGFGNTIGGLFIGLGLVLAGNVLALVWSQKQISPQRTSAR